MRLEILPCDLKLRVRLWGVGPRTSCFVSLPEGCDAFFPSRSLIPESQSHDPSHSQRPSPFIQNRRTYLLSPLVSKFFHTVNSDHSFPSPISSQVFPHIFDLPWFFSYCHDCLPTPSPPPPHSFSDRPFHNPVINSLKATWLRAAVVQVRSIYVYTVVAVLLGLL